MKKYSNYISEKFRASNETIIVDAPNNKDELFELIKKTCNKKSLDNGILDISHIDLSKITDFTGLFKQTTFKKIILRNCDLSNVDNTSDMFFYCENLEEVDLTNTNLHISYAFGMFENCEKLKIIKGLNELKTEKLENATRMFAYCKSLEEIDLSNWDFSNLEVAASMFKDCKNLQKINLHNLKDSSLRDIRFMFKNCESLQYIDFGDFKPRLLTKQTQMFVNTPKLKKPAWYSK